MRCSSIEIVKDINSKLVNRQQHFKFQYSGKNCNYILTFAPDTSHFPIIKYDYYEQLINNECRFQCRALWLHVQRYINDDIYK